MRTRTIRRWVTAAGAVMATVAPWLVSTAIAGAPDRDQISRAEEALAEQARDRDERDRERGEQQRERLAQAREIVQQQFERSLHQREHVEDLYESGQLALEREQWSQAVERFSVLVSTGAPKADAALYWRAYALDKLNRQADALTSVAELLKTFPTSRWLGEARALEIQVRQRAGQPVSPDDTADDDLKLLALQGLQHSNPDQALPLLEKFLQGSQSPRLKERALFVLAQSNSERARQVLTGIARGNTNPDLQRKAVQYLGLNGSAENRQLLAEIYASSSDIDLKRQVLRAFMASGDRPRVLAAATNEKAPELRGEAGRLLGMMGARDEVWQLFQKEPAVEVRQQVLQAISMSGDAARLIQVANTDADPNIRRRAVQHLGMMDRQQTGTAILTIYGGRTSTDLKRAAIDALFIQKNAETLVDLARKETDPELKRHIVQKLSLMGSPVAVNYLVELLNK